MLFLYIKKVLRKNCFLCINENYNDCHKRKTKRPLYIYNKKEKSQNIIYKKARHFAKRKTIFVMFLYTESKKLYVTQFFMNFLKLEFIFKNHDTFHCVTFYIQKVIYLRKKQDNLHYVFLYNNPNTALHNF